MVNVGISNVVSNTNNQIFVAISWKNSSVYSGKMCRLSNVQTNDPVSTCVENPQFFLLTNALLALNDATIFLFTTVFDQTIGQVPAVVDTKTLEFVWIDRTVPGAASDSLYTSDTTGIFWIGHDEHMHKINGADVKLLDIGVHSEGNRYYAYDRFQATIIRAWQNGSITSGRLIISAWDANLEGEFGLRWQWNQPERRTTQSTQPVSDDRGGNDIYFCITLYVCHQYGWIVTMENRNCLWR